MPYTPMTVETPSNIKVAPRILLPHKLWEALTLLCEKNADEWMLFGKTRQEGNDFILEDFYVPKQSNTKGTTNVAEEGMGEMLEDLVNKEENPADWNVWIHSHNTMGCFWSGTDHNQMASFDGDGPDFFLSIVVSTQVKKGIYCDALGAISFYKPVKATITPIEVLLLEDKDESFYKTLQEDLNLKQTKPYSFTPSYPGTQWQKPLDEDYDEFFRQKKFPMQKTFEDHDDPNDISPGTAEIDLDDIFLEIYENGGFMEYKHNVAILEAIKKFHNNYETIINFEKRFVRLMAQYYDVDKKEIMKRIGPAIQANSSVIRNLIKCYNQ